MLKFYTYKYSGADMIADNPFKYFPQANELFKQYEGQLQEKLNPNQQNLLFWFFQVHEIPRLTNNVDESEVELGSLSNSEVLDAAIVVALKTYLLENGIE